jgi:gamma-glutamyltranspeptidase/glutathione hydrolase
MNTSIPHTVAGDPQTAAAGTAMLKAGGNCVDAAVAATFAACIAEPVLTGPLGGGFAMVSLPQQPPQAWPFFARVPGQASQTLHSQDFQALTVSFGPTTQTFYAGRGTAAVPLLTPGLLTLHRQHGRLPLTQIVQPAVQLCRQGAHISSTLAPIVRILEPIVTLTPAVQHRFAPQGTCLAAGDVFYNPTLAVALEKIATGTTDWLYDALFQLCQPPFGSIEPADCSTLAIQPQAPLSLSLPNDTLVLTQPPPSLAGMLVHLGLKMLAEHLKPNWQNETEVYTALFHCLAFTQKMRTQHVDPAANSGLHALENIAHTFTTPEFWHQVDFSAHGVKPSVGSHLGSTTHISAIDQDGGVCCITSSNGEGCGHIVPELGVMANNFLGEEDINPQGLLQATPGSHMVSMMCPTVVQQHGKPLLALGTGGSNRIRTALLQTLAHFILGKTNLDQAVHAPRIHYEGQTLYVERQIGTRRLQPATLAALTHLSQGDIVFFDSPNMFFGGVHIAGLPLGIGDIRRSGTVATV